MTLLRNIWADLRDKKLWPIAVVLLVALVAIPTVLGGSSEQPAADVAAVPTPSGGTPAGKAAVVALEEQAAAGAKVTREGKTRNPFVQHHQPKPTATTEAVASALDAAKDVVSGSGGASADATPSTPTPEPSQQPGTGTGSGTGSDTPKKPSKTTYRVDLAFGESDATKTYKNVARLTPLPSADNPLFVFLGVSDDGKSATFMVSDLAEPSGDGTCAPSHDTCETLTLKAGETEFFDLQSGTAGVVQYQLDLRSIHKAKAASSASAARAHARESRAGRAVLRDVLSENPDALDGWAFERATGLLVAVDPGGDEAHLPASVSSAAAGQAKAGAATLTATPGR